MKPKPGAIITAVYELSGLGGLDSHVLKVDSGIGSPAMLKHLEELMLRREPIFVTGLFNANTAVLLANMLKNRNAVFFDPTDSAMWQLAVTSPDQLLTMDGSHFFTKFQNRYGYSPNHDVLRGYIAARLIAETVRSLGEEQLARTFHKHARALACSLISQGIILNRPDQ